MGKARETTLAFPPSHHSSRLAICAETTGDESDENPMPNNFSKSLFFSKDYCIINLNLDQESSAPSKRGHKFSPGAVFFLWGEGGKGGGGGGWLGGGKECFLREGGGSWFIRFIITCDQAFFFFSFLPPQNK